VPHVYQLGLDIQSVAAVQNPPGQHRAHPQAGSDLLRVYLLTFVAKDRAPGHDFQLWQL
jgi:hypothetical protein